jgi:large subunit ribosomal protein L17
MRHRRQTKRFGRNPKERKAMLENLVTSLLTHQQITTTLEKAKETKKLAERIITLGKEDSLHSRRMAFSYLQDHALTSKLFKEVAPRFKSRSGGYTRILQLSRRKGDGAQLALLELTEKEIKVKEAKPKKAKEHKHDGHDHDHKHDAPKAEGAPKPKAKGPEKGADPKKGNFFGNIGKFFRNKGGG